MLHEESLVTNEASNLIVEKFEVTAAHLHAAVMHYRAAARHYEVGDKEKASLNSCTAQRHIKLAQYAQENINIELNE